MGMKRKRTEKGNMNREEGVGEEGDEEEGNREKGGYCLEVLHPK
jgi:hypothetical protein